MACRAGGSQRQVVRAKGKPAPAAGPKRGRPRSEKAQQAILDATLPPDHPFIANTLRGLRRLYGEEAMNDPAKLADVQARLERLDGNRGAPEP